MEILHFDQHEIDRFLLDTDLEDRANEVLPVPADPATRPAVGVKGVMAISRVRTQLQPWRPGTTDPGAAAWIGGRSSSISP